MPVSNADVAFVRDLVYKRAAIALDAGKEYLIEARLEQVVRDGGIRSINDLIQKARAGDAVANRQIIEAISTHETSFFRDFKPFELLRQQLLPRMLLARSRTQSLTIWSAACSSGQEPYSIAMILREHFPQTSSWNIRIIATDLSAKILEQAQAARFRQLEVNRGLPAAMLVKYFQRIGGDWVLKDEIKKMVSFRQLNLLEQWNIYPSPDIVFMRNVLIYFDLPTKRAIFDRLRQLLSNDAVLVLGAAETVLHVADGWERVHESQMSYYRVAR